MTTAASLIRRAYDLLQDSSAVRWKVPEMVRWLNDGQRAIQTLRPDATATTQTVALLPGVRQDARSLTLAKPFSKLFDISRNMAATSRMRPITKVPRTLLEAHLPTWYTTAPSVNILHFAFDPRDPEVFVVYPPAPAAPAAPAQVEMIYSAHPTDVPEPTGGGPFVWSDVSGDIDINDDFQLPLIDYMMYRAMSKDAEEGNKTLAASYFSVFQAGVGADSQAAASVQPQSTSGA